MIKIGNKELIDFHVGTRVGTAIYLGTKLIWEKISEFLSCFSSGIWRDDYPWVDDETWTD